MEIMRPKAAPRFTPQLFLGLAVLVTGVVFLLHNLGIADLRLYLGYWPWLLMLLGAIKLVKARSVPAALVGLFWMALAIWLRPSLFGVDLSVIRTYWPLILILLGAVIVWHTFRRTAEPLCRHDVDLRSWSTATAVLAGVSRSIASPEFAGGEVTAFMGGVQLDLTRANIKGPEAHLTMFAMWGGIELKVPSGWVVEMRVNAFLGGYEDKTTPPADENAPRLIISGLLTMGGAEIKNG
jgi:predicted membrane protein